MTESNEVFIRHRLAFCAGRCRDRYRTLRRRPHQHHLSGDHGRPPLHPPADEHQHLPRYGESDAQCRTGHLHSQGSGQRDAGHCAHHLRRHLGRDRWRRMARLQVHRTHRVLQPRAEPGRVPRSRQRIRRLPELPVRIRRQPADRNHRPLPRHPASFRGLQGRPRRGQARPRRRMPAGNRLLSESRRPVCRRDGWAQGRFDSAARDPQ